jgi:hypothetical protein
MADKQPKKGFLFFGRAPGAPVVSMASKSEAEELAGDDDQTSDLLALTRKPAATQREKPALEANPLEKQAIKKTQAERLAELRAKVQKTKQPVAEQPQKPKEEPVLPKDVDLSKYDEEYQEYAIDILGEEHKNPYKDKTAAPVFPLQTRLGFQEQILKVYNDFIKVPEFGKEPDYDACKKIASSVQQEVETYEYQKFVRDYLRQASPYRGLLVYHGLGSGKTCSAIAAAEALFSSTGKKIIVMTPFSLRDNFIRELTFCGFRHFRLQNFWVKLDPENPLTYTFAQEILHLPADYLRRRPAIWVPDFSQPPNFKSLSDEDRQQITKQVQTQINNQITFISYNGITATKLKEYACMERDENGYGFFDNKIIVVDEVHNLIRLMQGTIEPYLTTIESKISGYSKKRKVPYEPIVPGPWKPALCAKVTDAKRSTLTNYKRGYTLYRLLSTAKNSKLIGLSGTPLINFPEEIAILMNVLGGYIDTSTFTVIPGTEQNKKIVETLLESNTFIDFKEVKVLGTSISVLFTLLPEGMIKVEGGVQRAPPGTVLKTIQQITSELIIDLDGRGIKVNKGPIYTSYPLLPPVGEDFRKDFLEKDSYALKNTVVLRKRLQGLISYYRGSKKELMPQVTKDELVRVPMSAYSQGEYQRVRGEEISRAQEVKKQQGPAGEMSAIGGKMAALWAEFYDLSKMKQPNSYRMASRQASNFAFPEGIVRPRPGTIEDAVVELGVDKEIIDSVASGGKGIDEKPEIQIQTIGENVEEAEAEDESIDREAKLAAKQEVEAGAGASEAGAGGAGAAALRAEEEESDSEEFVPVREMEAAREEGDTQAAVAAGNGAVPRGQLGGAGGDEKKTLSMANRLKLQRTQEKEACKRGRLPGEDYEVATRRAKKCLETFAGPKLRLFAPGKKIIDEIRAGTSPDPERLSKYSPKYAAILQKIIEAPGSSLVYSQFLDMEGIGIFLSVLKINEFQPITIESDGAGSFRFSALTVKSLEKKDGMFRYLSFTGGEDREVRSLALKIFNAKYEQGRFTELPPQISEVLVANGFTGNTTGELCRVFCITSAGAEGLSLRNVRRVHIMEPYWNHVRTDQVKGRAVRICSHMDLELEERNVEVYTYCSVYDQNALLHPGGDGGFPRIDQTLMNTDGLKPEDARKEGYPIPAGAREYIVTSDEYLYSLSERKKLILENIQNLMKTSAVDCLINQYENEEEGLGCIKIPGTPEQYAYHPILSEDIAYTSTMYSEAEAGVSEARAAGASAALGGVEPTRPMEGATGKVEKPLEKAKPQTLQAKVLTIQGVPYIVVPKKEAQSGVVLSYDIYARGDIKRTKKLGTMVASPDGGYTDDIVFF